MGMISQARGTGSATVSQAFSELRAGIDSTISVFAERLTLLGQRDGLDKREPIKDFPRRRDSNRVPTTEGEVHMPLTELAVGIGSLELLRSLERELVAVVTASIDRETDLICGIVKGSRTQDAPAVESGTNRVLEIGLVTEQCRKIEEIAGSDLQKHVPAILAALESARREVSDEADYRRALGIMMVAAGVLMGITRNYAGHFENEVTMAGFDPARHARITIRKDGKDQA